MMAPMTGSLYVKETLCPKLNDNNEVWCGCNGLFHLPVMNEGGIEPRLVLIRHR